MDLEEVHLRWTVRSFGFHVGMCRQPRGSLGARRFGDDGSGGPDPGPLMGGFGQWPDHPPVSACVLALAS